jgi:hypothetical protein
MWRALLALFSSFCCASVASVRAGRQLSRSLSMVLACAVKPTPNGLYCPRKCARFASDSVPIRASFGIGAKLPKPAPRLGLRRIGTVPILSIPRFRFYLANRNRYSGAFQGLRVVFAPPKSQTGQRFAPGPLLLPAPFKTAHSSNGRASTFVHFRSKIRQS